LTVIRSTDVQPLLGPLGTHLRGSRRLPCRAAERVLPLTPGRQAADTCRWGR